MRAAGATVIEPTAEAEDAWVAHHDETANATLISKTDSWYTGSNVAGKPRRVLSYTGGATSAAHTDADIDHTLDIFRETIQTLLDDQVIARIK